MRLRQREEYVRRFLGFKWKEVHLKYLGGKLFVGIVFETRYAPYVPRGFTAVDVNLRQLTLFNGFEVKRLRTRFIDALSKRARAEELMRKYPRRWRFNRRILSRVRALHRESRNIVTDDSWKLARRIVQYSGRHGHAIVLEDLNGLRSSINGKPSLITWKLSYSPTGDPSKL
ncbi:IS200/IS605 family element transposase accessory protein TnpB [Vulcanisaeta moutnovskia]|uniref:IS200/IS605 family element transposase accessory protein TnpB n=1 Tax=Vulcanisaeta moutnovskia TaxID=985052 RepID=UPI00064F3920|nr:IS200/IS605 family element transposase accessory protein TnpB [Vulcanisaeta moutnovskia]